MIRILAAVAGSLVIAVVLVDVFITIISARRTRNSFRISRLVYQLSWRPWAAVGKRIRSSNRREGFLAVYGPLSLISVFGLWAVILTMAFGFLQWAAGLRPSTQAGSLANDFYLSATTFLTLEAPDPRNTGSKWITVIEAGLGFSLLGVVVGYLPVFYGAFARRELQISLLDARGGSPPSALKLMALQVSDVRRAERYLERWEKWAGEVLENQLSFPMMALFRSHHANQSWLTALTAMTDCAALITVCADGDLRLQAEFTFAMARHALVDISAILRLSPLPPAIQRLSPEDLDLIRETIRKSPLPLDADLLSEEKLTDLTAMYEPFAHALSVYLLMALPTWKSGGESRENWRLRPSSHLGAPYAVSDPFRSDRH